MKKFVFFTLLFGNCGQLHLTQNSSASLHELGPNTHIKHPQEKRHKIESVLHAHPSPSILTPLLEETQLLRQFVEGACSIFLAYYEGIYDDVNTVRQCLSIAYNTLSNIIMQNIPNSASNPLDILSKILNLPTLNFDPIVSDWRRGCRFRKLLQQYHIKSTSNLSQILELLNTKHLDSLSSSFEDLYNEIVKRKTILEHAFAMLKYKSPVDVVHFLAQHHGGLGFQVSLDIKVNDSSSGLQVILNPVISDKLDDELKLRTALWSTMENIERRGAYIKTMCLQFVEFYTFLINNPSFLFELVDLYEKFQSPNLDVTEVVYNSSDSDDESTTQKKGGLYVLGHSNWDNLAAFGASSDSDEEDANDDEVTKSGLQLVTLDDYFETDSSSLEV